MFSPASNGAKLNWTELKTLYFNKPATNDRVVGGGSFAFIHRLTDWLIFNERATPFQTNVNNHDNQPASSFETSECRKRAERQMWPNESESENLSPLVSPSRSHYVLLVGSS